MIFLVSESLRRRAKLSSEERGKGREEVRQLEGRLVAKEPGLGARCASR